MGGEEQQAVGGVGGEWRMGRWAEEEPKCT